MKWEALVKWISEIRREKISWRTSVKNATADLTNLLRSRLTFLAGIKVFIAPEQTSSTHLHFIVGKQDGAIMANKSTLTMHGPYYTLHQYTLGSITSRRCLQRPSEHGQVGSLCGDNINFSTNHAHNKRRSHGMIWEWLKTLTDVVSSLTRH